MVGAIQIHQPLLSRHSLPFSPLSRFSPSPPPLLASATQARMVSKDMVQIPRGAGTAVACENIRFSSLFAAGDVSRETSPATNSEEKRMFLQASTAGNSWWACAAQFSKSWPYFRPKKCNLPHPFSDQTSKIHTRFQTWPLGRNFVIIT